MRNRELISLILIAVVTVLALWINLVPSQTFLGRDVSFRLGLDLQGGIQVLLRSTDPETTPEEMETARRVIERRVNALGVGETVVQLAGNDRLIVELPGVENPEQAIDTLRGTGRLEFIDSQGQFLAPGTVVRTSNSPDPPQLSATEGVTETVDPATLGPIYQSITDGADLDTSSVQRPFRRPALPAGPPCHSPSAANRLRAWPDSPPATLASRCASSSTTASSVVLWLTPR